MIYLSGLGHGVKVDELKRKSRDSDRNRDENVREHQESFKEKGPPKILKIERKKRYAFIFQAIKETIIADERRRLVEIC